MFIANYRDTFCFGHSLQDAYNLIIYKLGCKIDIDDICFYEHVSVKIETKTTVTKDD